MVFNVIPVMMALSYMLSRGKDVADFTNDLFNNLVTVSSDSHQARMAQDIFRQEVRHERSMQIREDIRDQRKVMLESVTSYLYFGSILLAGSFVTLIEGFPPLGTSRVVLLWWLLFGLWSLTYQLLALWYALAFQVKLSQFAKERLLRRYRYRLPDDQLVDRMGGKSLTSTYGLLLSGIRNAFSTPEFDEPVPTEPVSENQLTVKVNNLNSNMPLDVTKLKKEMHAWLHASGQGYAKPTIVDVPYYLLNETLIRCPWTFRGETPLIFRVRGETTLYIASQCPPLGGATKDSKVSLIGYGRALGAFVKDWPSEEMPIVTAGYHPAWKGQSGHGEFRRVDGASIFVDSDVALELPVYKIVLASPRDGPDGYVDVVVCWQFETHCEGLCMMLRKGSVHCQEDDWPMAEFNSEICRIMPLQDHSGNFMRRGTSLLFFNIMTAVLSKLWTLGDRPAWWLEIVVMAIILLPGLVIMNYIPINIRSTLETVSMSAINRVHHGRKDFEATASNDLTEQKERDHLAAEVEQLRRQIQARVVDAAPAAESQSRVPRQSGGRVGAGTEDREDGGASNPQQSVRIEVDGAGVDSQVLWPPAPSGDVRNDSNAPPTSGFSRCCSLELPPTRARETLRTGSAASMSQSSPETPIAAGGLCTPGPVMPSSQQIQTGSWPSSPGRRPTLSRAGSSIAPSDSEIVGDWFPSRTSLKSSSLGGGSSGCGTSDSERGADRQFARWCPNTWASWLCDVAALFFPRFCPFVSRFHLFSSLSDPNGDIAKALYRITRFLDFVFVISVIVVMSSPAIEWFQASVYLGVSKEYEASGADRRLEIGGRLLHQASREALKWIEVPVSWPPFLHPTAAVLDASNSLLFVASGSVLWTLGAIVDNRSSVSFSVMGSPMILPEAVHGLGLSGNALVAIGDAAAYQLEGAQLVSARTAPLHAEQGLMDLATIATQAGSGPSPTWAHHIGPVDAAVYFQVSRQNMSSPAAVIASRNRDLSFCSPTKATTGEVGMLTQLENLGRPLHNISGLHVSMGLDMVLWAANHSGGIIALGLNTGRSLGSFDAFAGTRNTDRHLRGHAPARRFTRVLALTGNATHLCMVAEGERRYPALLCAPYPVLGDGEDVGMEL